MKIIIFGNVPLATWVAQQILTSSKYELFAVVCERQKLDYTHHKLPYPSLYEYALNEGLTILDYEAISEQLEHLANGMGISCRFPKIIPDSVRAKFGRGMINFHGGELPRFRGVNIANHSILEGAEKGAGTIHFIDSGVDTGDIIKRKYFPIQDADTAYDVFIKTQTALMEAFSEAMPKLWQTDQIGEPQSTFLANGETSKTFRHRDLDNNREVFLSDSPETILRKVRAYQFPGHPPAFARVGGRKINLTFEADS